MTFCTALGARLGKEAPDALPIFSKLRCEADLCVLVNFADGSSDILETNQEEINGRKVNVFKGKALSTGKKAVIIPRDDNEVNLEETIIFKSLKAGGCTKFSIDLSDFSGEATAECLKNAPRPRNEKDEIEDRGVRLDYLPEDRSMDRSLEEMELAPRELDPNGYKLKVAVHYDDMFAEEFKRSGAVDRVAAIMAIVDEMYSETDTLKTELEVTTVAIEHAKGENWGIVRKWCTEVICESCPAAQIASNSELDVDLHVFITGSDSYDGLGLANFGVVCSRKKQRKLSISKYSCKKGASLKGCDAYTADTIAHEMGHNLGMKHDCLEEDCRTWLSTYKGPRTIGGQECYGYMDYIGTTNYWSPCSVSDFTSYINRQQRFCLEKIKPDIVDSGPTRPIVCNNIKLTTKGYGRVVVWAYGSCFSEVEYKDYDMKYWAVKEKEYNIECCQPEGEYELRCIDKFEWCHGGEGWKGGYIQIGESETKYCEDFNGGGVQTHKGIKHTASSVPNAYLSMKLTTKERADQIFWTIGPCSSRQSELGSRYRQAYQDNREYEFDCFLPAGTYDLICEDQYGDGWSGAYIEIAGTKYCEDFDENDGFQKTIAVTVD